MILILVMKYVTDSKCTFKIKWDSLTALFALGSIKILKLDALICWFYAFICVFFFMQDAPIILLLSRRMSFWAAYVSQVSFLNEYVPFQSNHSLPK